MKSFPPGAQSYDSIVRRMADAKTKAVFVGAYALDIAVIAREVAAAKLPIAILASDAVIGPSLHGGRRQGRGSPCSSPIRPTLWICRSAKPDLCLGPGLG
jgi:hypothetical protein